jgi:hypothetical protein
VLSFQFRKAGDVRGRDRLLDEDNCRACPGHTAQESMSL